MPLLLTGAPPAIAENDDALRYPRGFSVAPASPRRQQTVRPAPGGYGNAVPTQRAPVQPYAGPAFYGNIDPNYDPRRDPRYRAPVQRADPRPDAPRRAARRSPPAAAPQTAPAEPTKQEAKVEITTRIAVFGDSLADLVADGLSEAFEDAAEVEVTSEAKADSGLSRTDVQDWPKAVRDYLGSNQKLSIGVMMLGINDRQSIREGEQTHEPLSDRWRQLYAARVDAVAAAFARGDADVAQLPGRLHRQQLRQVIFPGQQVVHLHQVEARHLPQAARRFHLLRPPLALGNPHLVGGKDTPGSRPACEPFADDRLRRAVHRR